jgi:hypothetical protein
VESAEIDPETGLLATSGCPSVRTEVFLEGQAPWRSCYLHEPTDGDTLRLAREAVGEEREAADEVSEEERRPWWKRIFGRKRKASDDG